MTLTNDDLAPILASLGKSNQKFNALYPGDSPRRQPIHTVYGGAHLFKSDATGKLGKVAERAFQEHAPDFITLARLLEFRGSESLPEPGSPQAAVLEKLLDTDAETLRRQQPAAWLAGSVYRRVLEKLRREPVEDFRIDFEDGFGVRSNEEEDSTAETSARETAKGMKAGTLPPFIGIRIKMLSEDLKARAIRTLDIFVSTLVGETAGKLPENFVVTLPKVTIPEQISALVEVFEKLETKLKLPTGTLRMEFMVETTQAIIGPDGRSPLPAFALAAKGRCTGAHFGTYDFTASCSVTAVYQTMDHPSCVFALHTMKMTLGGTGIWLSDGSTNIMPVGTDRSAIHSAWKLAYGHIRHSLKLGFYQGWDLHPAQFPIRYAACFAFFLEGFTEASDRLANFIDKAAKATLTSNIFDDAATGQGLLNYFLRALNCGAITETESLATGLTLEEIRMRSFAKIIAHRTGL